MVVTVVSAYKKGVIMYTLETRSLLCVAFKNVDDVYDVAQFINNTYVFKLTQTYMSYTGLYYAISQTYVRKPQRSI